MGASQRPGPRPGRRHAGGHGHQPTAQRLANQEHVGRNLHEVRCELGAGTTQAGLNLVDHGQTTRLAAYLGRIVQVTRRRHADAAFTLDRFDKEGRGTIPMAGILQGRDVAEGNLRDIGQQRAESPAVIRVAHQGQGPGAQAVPAAVARQ